MRVLIISWEYPPYINGGMGRHVAELIPALTQQGIEVHVVTPTFELLNRSNQFHVQTQFTDNETSIMVSVTQEGGVTVHRVLVPQDDKAKTDIFNQAKFVNQRIEAYLEYLDAQGSRWDLVHIHDWLTGFAGLHLKQTQTIPLVSTIHATERGRVRGFLNSPLQQAIDQTEHDLVHGSDRVIVCSRFMSHELQSFFQVPLSKLEVIPNGIEINRFQHFDNLDDFRAKYAAPDERIVFTISRLVYEKGVHRLIEATPGILAKCPRAKIIVAGRGPEAKNLRNQAEQLGISDRVKFVGFISNEERDRFFKIASCAVFPSLYEPFGIVALEAMALECPVVVSYVGGLAEVVTHQETGITIFPDDAASVAWGVSYSLTHPVWARRHALKARQVVEEQFNWTRIASLTKALYRQTIEAQNNQ